MVALYFSVNIVYTNSRGVCMEFVTNLKKEEYEAFVSQNPNGHFMQSYYFGQIQKEKHFIPHYVGLKEKGKLVCTALLLEKKLIMNYCYFYSPRGYVIDYTDKKLVKEFSDALKKYAKEKKALFIKMDPAVKLHNLTPNGEILDGVDNKPLVKYLKQLGYRHQGYNLNFENQQPRFTFRINLDKPWEEIYNAMHPTTRKILNKKNQYQFSIYKGDKKDIKDFYITMVETAKREGILQAPISYYETFYSIFHEQDLSDLYIVKANIKNLLALFNTKIADIQKEIDALQDAKYKNKEKVKNKKQELTNQLNKLNKEQAEIKKIKEKEIVLSSIITVKYGDCVWTVHGGNHSLLMNLNANYLCYYTIMKDAYENGYKRMDCFGACGVANPDKTNPIAGLHTFKKRLGGEYIEFIGEFDFVIYPFLYFLFKKLIPIYRKLIRSIKKNESEK